MNDDFYNSRTWRKVRKNHLRKETLCRMCREIGKINSAGVVDHIVPISQGGDKLSPDNFQSLCEPCHNRHKQKLDKTGILNGADKNGFPVDKNHHWNK